MYTYFLTKYDCVKLLSWVNIYLKSVNFLPFFLLSIYVDYHKQRSISVCEDINVHEVKQMCGLQGFP